MMPSGKRAASLRQQPLSAHLSHYTGVSPHDASTIQNINALRACMTLLREKPFKRRQPSPYPPDFPFSPANIFREKAVPETAKTLRLSLRTGLKRFRHGNIILRQGRLRRRSVYGGGTVKMAGNLLGQSGDVIGITPARREGGRRRLLRQRRRRRPGRP